MMQIYTTSQSKWCLITKVNIVCKAVNSYLKKVSNQSNHDTRIWYHGMPHQKNVHRLDPSLLSHSQSREIPVNRPLSHVAMLSLRRKQELLLQCEACHVKTKLFILLRLNMAAKWQRFFPIHLVKVIVWPLLLYHLGLALHLMKIQYLLIIIKSYSIHTDIGMIIKTYPKLPLCAEWIIFDLFYFFDLS